MRGIFAQGDRAAACAVYQKAIEAAAERGTEGEQTYIYLTVQYAHFLVVVYKDVEGARSVYSAALDRLPRSPHPLGGRNPPRADCWRPGKPMQAWSLGHHDI